MIRIHTLLVGRPREIHDEQGTWSSSIFRTPVTGPVQLHVHGLDGDRVTDTEHHGLPEQAVCCHPLDHYAYWNDLYSLDEPDAMLGPGAVGENWSLSGGTERDVCVGDLFRVGSARVQVTGPRFPCWKQERKLGLPAFLRRTIETLRTGFYLRVLEPGLVQAGDPWTLDERPHPEMTVHRVNECAHHTFDPEFAARALETVEIAPIWKYIFRVKAARRRPEPLPDA